MIILDLQSGIHLIGVNQYQIEQWITSTDFDGDKRITFEEFKFSAAGNSLIDLEP